MEELNNKISEIKIIKKTHKKLKINNNKKIKLSYEKSELQDISIDEELKVLVKNMRIKEEKKNNEKIIQKISSCINLTQKCVFAREYLTPQSTTFQYIIMNDLEINEPINEISGDGCKNNINYEIKTSIHAKGCKQNFVQIRPDHNIDYYILISYNLYDNTSEIGKAFIFKIPSNNLYELVVKYGGYAHGTCEILGEINIENIKGRNCEYAIRCDPNKKEGKNYDIWNELLKYEVEYNKENF